MKLEPDFYKLEHLVGTWWWEKLWQFRKTFSSFEGNFSNWYFANFIPRLILFNNLFRCLASSGGKTICGKLPQLHQFSSLSKAKID